MGSLSIEVDSILCRQLALSRFGELRDGAALRAGAVRILHRLSGCELLVSGRIAEMFRPTGSDAGVDVLAVTGSQRSRDTLERSVRTLLDARLLVECGPDSQGETAPGPLWNARLVAAPLSVEVLDETNVLMHPLQARASCSLTLGAMELVLRFHKPAVVADVAQELYGGLRPQEREELLELVQRLIHSHVLAEADAAPELAPEDAAFLSAYAATRRPLAAPTYLESPPPPIFKHYGGPSVAMPRVQGQSHVSLEQAISSRRSRRTFSSEPVTLEQVGGLLALANGLKGIVDDGHFGPCAQTTSPSAGCRHPLEIYVAAVRVQGLEPGIHHYDLPEHALVGVRGGEGFSRQVVQSLINLEAPDTVAAVLLITAVFRRSTWKYGPRAFRFVHLDAGHLGQNVYLAAESVGLGVCGVGGWREEALEELLELDASQERVIYALILGKPREGTTGGIG